jgi:hypothetical protein
MSRRQKPPVGDELHRLLSDLDHHNVKRLAERGEAALRLVYSVLNRTIRKEKPKQGQISAFLPLKICYPGVRCR